MFLGTILVLHQKPFTLLKTVFCTKSFTRTLGGNEFIYYWDTMKHNLMQFCFPSNHLTADYHEAWNCYNQRLRILFHNSELVFPLTKVIEEKYYVLVDVNIYREKHTSFSFYFIKFTILGYSFNFLMISMETHVIKYGF